MPQNPQKSISTEPIYRKQDKFPQAHLPGDPQSMDPAGSGPEGQLHVQHSVILPEARQWLPGGTGFPVLQQILHIEKEQPLFFFPLDLSGLAWQMTLNQEQATTTAFTLPGRGPFQWTQTPLGVIGAETLLHRLLSSLFSKLPGTLVHIDRVINWTHSCQGQFYELK